MKVKTIIAKNAPPAVGPYSHAAIHENTVYISGCLALDENAKFLGGTAAQQAQQALTNLEHVLNASGSSKTSVAKIVIFLTDMADFASVNDIYSAFFGTHKPARSCLAVAELPINALVEIEAVAALK